MVALVSPGFWWVNQGDVYEGFRLEEVGVGSGYMGGGFIGPVEPKAQVRNFGAGVVAFYAVEGEVGWPVEVEVHQEGPFPAGNI